VELVYTTSADGESKCEIKSSIDYLKGTFHGYDLNNLPITLGLEDSSVRVDCNCRRTGG
jgi:hypothetical protein